MSSFDFKDQIKECHLPIRLHDGIDHMLTCTILEFLDKIIIHLAMDGETDISYDIQMPELDDLKKPRRIYNYDDEIEDEGNDGVLNSSIVPTALIGGYDNMKTQVLASQIGHIMGQLSTKNLILNVNGRIFGKPGIDTEYHPNDSTLMQQIIHLVKETYNS